MWCGCEDNLGRAWTPRTRLKVQAERAESKPQDLQRLIRLVTEALRPFQEARMAVVRVLRLDSGLPEVPE
jgi:hypothetical protein